jgi:hypothetical protein
VTITGSPARRLVTLALTAVLAAGCGGDSTPADAAPELAEQLARVDRAVTTGDEARIRERVESLVAATEAARDAGRIDDEQADRILTAADALLGRLPAEEPASEPPSPPPSPPTTPPSPEDEDEDKPEKHGKDKKDEKDEKDEDKPGKGEGHEEDDDD